MSDPLYPLGTDLLWQAVFRHDPAIGLADGVVLKLSGTLEEAAKECESFAGENQMVLQMLNRRY